MQLEEFNQRQTDLRDKCGRSELNRQRQVAELQAELSNISKKLRATKNQNVELARKFIVTQPQQLPQPSPPVFHNRSATDSMQMFGDVQYMFPPVAAIPGRKRSS